MRRLSAPETAFCARLFSALPAALPLDARRFSYYNEDTGPPKSILRRAAATILSFCTQGRGRVEAEIIRNNRTGCARLPVLPVFSAGSIFYCLRHELYS